jgi:hypothetical protein
MKNPSGFYVYGIKRDNQLIYIGKGIGGRVYRSLKKHGGNAFVIFTDNLSEEEAFQHEKVIIKAMRNCGLYLDNVR